MEVIVKAGVRSYEQQSLASLEEAAGPGILSRLTDVLIQIAVEIDDNAEADIRYANLDAYVHASSRQKAFVDGLLTELRKPHDAIHVIDVLEKWGIFSKHENIAIWKEKLGRMKTFNQEIEIAAGKLLKTVSERSLKIEGRRNLLNSRSFAIDKANTRDVDDAISYDLTKNTILIHIADPAEYFSVRNDHVLVKEASKRILTIYSGERKLSLFPEDISSNLFSLTGGSEGVNYATTYEYQILQDGSIDMDSMEVYSSVIPKPVCLTHRQAGQLLDNPSHKYYPIIHMLYKLALLRQNWRLAHGASSSETRPSGNAAETRARLLVDEMMITTNVVAAKLAQKNRIPMLYRGVHARRTAGGSCMSTFRGTRYMCSMYGTGTKNRNMEKGANVKLNVNPLKHVPLGVDEYVQATSPIRKFGDLIVNFQFNAMIRGLKTMPFGLRELTSLQNKILQMERIAGRVERRRNKYVSYQRLLKEGKKKHPGVIKIEASDEEEHNRGHWRNNDRRFESIWRRGVKLEKKEKWVVFLKDVGCDVVVVVPFEARRGMEVYVVIEEVNPRTSYLDAHIFKA